MFAQMLKIKTKPYHDQLESHFINSSLFGPNPTRADYIRFLQTQYQIWSPLEEKILLFQEKLQKIGIIYNSRVNDLKDELILLRETPSKIDFDPSFMDDFLAVLGAIYLMEGSRHGAFHILKVAKRMMGEDHRFLFLEMNQMVFFENWKNFMIQLENYVTTHNLENQFILAVCDLYEEFGRLYDKCAATHNM